MNKVIHLTVVQTTGVIARTKWQHGVYKKRRSP